jgi:hypothetical protein
MGVIKYIKNKYKNMSFLFKNIKQLVLLSFFGLSLSSLAFVPTAHSLSPVVAFTSSCSSSSIPAQLTQVKGASPICEYFGNTSFSDTVVFTLPYANTTTYQDYAGFFEFSLSSQNGLNPNDYYDITSIKDSFRQGLFTPVDSSVNVDLEAVKNSNSALLVRFVPSNSGFKDGTKEEQICDTTEVDLVTLNCTVSGFAKIKAETQGLVEITLKLKTSAPKGDFSFDSGLGKMVYVSNTQDSQIRNTREFKISGTTPTDVIVTPTPVPTPPPVPPTPPTTTPTPSTTLPSKVPVSTTPLVRTGATEVLLGLVYLISTLTMVLVLRLTFQKRS